MKSRNMHYYYNVEYFQDAMTVNDRDKKKIPKIYDANNRDIFRFRFKDESYRELILREKEGALKGRLHAFTLKTTYPGLLNGIGYEHGVKEKEAIKGGFFFDYVTGIPMIPGSTLKGMLKSYFREKKREVVNELAESVGVDLSGVETRELAENLFEKEDVFIGGFPVVQSNGLLLDSEYITPHNDEFKNPIPISLVKVRPEIEFQFIFLLHDDKKLKADQKEELYRELLKLGGIGAKTNVGFGQFYGED